mmetsp:Transcript_11913/g.33022  ORF Transcript_11913/g.33022 Transcript_11913/m.33022 type:complete len:360 (-) Transcript_11913:126-1205(-)
MRAAVVAFGIATTPTWILIGCRAVVAARGSSSSRGMMTTTTKSATTASTRPSSSNNNRVELWILRHGQATHNPRAEKAKEEGCSFDEFLAWMRKDDSLDSPLTELGQEQANGVRRQLSSLDNDDKNRNKEFDLVISSPLSRALQTADLAFPPSSSSSRLQRRICIEDFREINGSLLNAQRRTRRELRQLFPHWNFDHLASDPDDTWTADALESYESVRERGRRGLAWILENAGDWTETSKKENNRHEPPPRIPKVLLVAHGGILRQTMQEMPGEIRVVDGRVSSSKQQQPQQPRQKDDEPQRRTSCSRFSNCELRRYSMEWWLEPREESTIDGGDDKDTSNTGFEQKRILLTELDIDGT